MTIIHILVNGNIGGIEVLCKDYIQYSKHNNIVLCLWGNGTITDEMIKNGVEVVNLHMSSKRIFGTIKKVVNFCIDKKADVVVEHHAAPLSHLCLMVIKFICPQIKTIAYAHCNATDMYQDSKKYSSYFRKLILVKSFRKVDGVIAISEFVKASLVKKMGVIKDKITVIYNGVDVSKFQRERSEIKSNETPKLIFVGRLIKEKGVQVILNSLWKIKNDLDYRMIIVGDGPYRKRLEEQSRELSLSERVEFYGSSRKIPDLLAESDIFIHVPVWEEGFGITVVEAMAAGLTCVCARSGGIPEIIQDKETGYLVEKGNCDELAEILRKILQEYDSNDNIRIRLSACDKSKKYAIEKYSEQLDDLFNSI